jgi:hypothetical protein
MQEFILDEKFFNTQVKKLDTGIALRIWWATMAGLKSPLP